ncbi:uncharacterized protein LOC130663314 isoform X2 [Microplitis mediator]|uniref:uncharacterized protein LOC130663314 isoform X2 n=1 Tax=Microplitis mediator TaxID=375433 RepID=UPI002557B743|nr:uncharacterized protein LOC130663314 isoform X2 [Microplitis mediator]
MDNQWSFDLLLLLLLIASLLLIKKVEPVKITSVEIPRVVRAGTEEPTILDCKYDLESSTTAALVVKWYVDEELLYQWIHNSPPKGSDEFEKFVDATYKASNDPNTMYRAVKLVRPSHELSGKIRCSISTQEDETDASEDMLVYSPETVFRLSDPMINEDSTQLTTRCLAEDLYPLPTIKLFQDKWVCSVQCLTTLDLLDYRILLGYHHHHHHPDDNGCFLLTTIKCKSFNTNNNH